MMKKTLLLIVAMSFAIASAGYPETVVTFVNDGEGDIFVRVALGPGACDQKSVFSVILLRPGKRESLPDNGDTSCYLYSRFEQPDIVPFGSGKASPGEVVELSIGPGFELLDFEYSTSGEELKNDEKRGQIFLPNGHPEEIRPGRGSVGRPSTPASRRPIADRTLARFIDPFTPPKSRTTCAKWATGRIPFDGEWKTCIGWKTEWKCMESRWVVIATGPDDYDLDDLFQDLKECAATSAVAAAVAALVSGGSAAAPAATEAFNYCLAAKVAGAVEVRIENQSSWTAWDGCY